MPSNRLHQRMGDAILVLDQLVIEGFLAKGLGAIISAKGGTCMKDWRSLKLLEVSPLSYRAY